MMAKIGDKETLANGDVYVYTDANFASGGKTQPRWVLYSNAEGQIALDSNTPDGGPSTWDILRWPAIIGGVILAVVLIRKLKK